MSTHAVEEQVDKQLHYRPWSSILRTALQELGKYEGHGEATGAELDGMGVVRPME